MGEKVAILGGGVAGLTAAHELAERGFQVVVFEARPIPGGKARSMPIEGSGTDGRPDLPAEHGFRFFPGFYRHVPDTMERIPCSSEECRRGHRVADHLVNATEMQIARKKGPPLRFSFASAGPPPLGFVTTMQFLLEYTRRLRITPDMSGYLVTRLIELMLASKEEWLSKYDDLSWFEFSGATTRFKTKRTYKKYLAGGITRTMVAARADEISARTAGCTMLKLLGSLSRGDGRADRVLDGPTNDVWIDPWLDHLVKEKEVVYLPSHTVSEIRCSDGAVDHVRIETPTGSIEVEADYYVAALPVEVMRALAANSSGLKTLTTFKNLRHLKTRWMNGVMLYLNKDMRQLRGHTIYVDSPWALTSIAQEQFWTKKLETMGDGQICDILSVDISDWKDGRSNYKTAWESGPEEVQRQVLEQLRVHLDEDPAQQLVENVVRAHIDPDITFGAQRAVNAEPLLINTPGSWEHRPEVTTEIENLFLASDYVRTDTDLATMEAANEAGRRAANAILKDLDRDDLCETWDWKPPISGPAREVASLVWKLPNRFLSLAGHLLNTDHDNLDDHLSDQPAARVADRLINGPTIREGGNVPEAVLPDSELEEFSDELYDDPEGTLDAVEQRLDERGTRARDLAGVPG